MYRRNARRLRFRSDQSGYGNAFILARKVRDLPDGAVAWPMDFDESRDRAAQYPVRPPLTQADAASGTGRRR
ncbi:hypothetical protein [Azospirillum argentinense]|uniref:Uncharacterized protein n=1 Tax=Azospirillum brasilense TaxID=192 RepID=A0A4D8QAH1_AZOBR|nr:hypothetical protein [Azospirillum argentinense]QCO07248.1 hypothetical protein D3867_35735 [Azospirillum argentinense]